MNIIALSLGRSILEEGSRERQRMQAYAAHLDAFHVIVLTRHIHEHGEPIHDRTLHLYPTHSRTRIGMLIDAYRIGRKLARNVSPTIVTAQDPFLIGVVSYLITCGTDTQFHVQVHGDYFSNVHWGDILTRPLLRFFGTILLKRACGIRVVSERIKKSLVKRGLLASHITVLPIRPELERFLSVTRKVREDTVVTFLMASRFAPEKNIPLALRAFRALTDAFPHTHMRLVGRGGEEKKIRTLITKLGIQDRVSILPWTEHIEQEMAQADVFILSSNHEAYGLTLIEAMAAGLPIITTNVGCVGEVILNGVHGIVVPVDEVGHMYDAMKRMVQDDIFRSRCGTEGRATAQTFARYTHDAYTKAWVAAHCCSEKEV